MSGFYWANRIRKVYRCRTAVVASRQCSLGWVLKLGALEVVDSAVSKFVATACLEGKDGLGAWCK